jgi:hypothetical protein
MNMKERLIVSLRLITDFRKIGSPLIFAIAFDLITDFLRNTINHDLALIFLQITEIVTIFTVWEKIVP